MQLLEFFRKFKRSSDWISVNNPPPRSKRVLVKSKDGSVNIGHLDPELENLNIWIAYMMEIGEKTYKFNILEPIEWREIPL